MSFLFFLLPLLGSIRVKSYPRQLTAQEEEELLFLFKNGDKDARDKLIEHNLRLVAHLSKKYSNTLEDKDDILSIGTMGLIKAVDSYKFDTNTKLSTYASRCIENEILMRLRSNKKRRNDSYLNSTIGFDKDGNEVALIDVISDDVCIETNAILDKNKQILKKALVTLEPRELEIIVKRYGLNGQMEQTQNEIAAELNISRSYVSRIEKKALYKLYFFFEKP